MSEVEMLEAEYRSLATKVIYAGFEGRSNPADDARLEALGEDLIRRNAADFWNSPRTALSAAA